jgi:hypothetical protein
VLLHYASPVRTALTALAPVAVGLLLIAPAATPATTPTGDAAKGLQLLLADSTQKRSAEFQAINKYGLVVGINEYDNKAQGINSLRFAVSDAEAVYQALVDPRRGGFKPENVAYLTDRSGEKPTSTAIGRALNRLITQTQEGDQVIIFFSGHGYEEEGRAYLLPANADLQALDYSAIERDAFIRQIDKIPAKKVIVILDACHSGGVSRGGKGAGKDAALSTKYYESFTGSQGRAFIASSSGGELSWEDETAQHGVFTASLVRALSGEADTEPRDGIITLNKVRRYLESQVSDWAGRRGKSQHPQINLESAYGDMPLAIDYSYLAEQSQTLTERRDQANHLRTALAGVEGLKPNEMSKSVDVVNRYGRNETLGEADAQLFEFARKLVDGSIDIKMFRAGVAKLIEPPMATPEQLGVLPRKRSTWSNPWLWGGVGVAAVGAVVALGGHGGSSNAQGPPLLPGPPNPPGN